MKPSIVLVHGHCHGGWCWDRVRPMLAAAGYPTFTPTLIGMGNRVSLLNRHIGLEAHVSDLQQFLVDRELRDVVLIGHSYAGMVITGAASREISRIRRLVYLDAPVPRDGESLFDCLPGIEALFRASVVDGWRLDPPDPAWWGVTDEADRVWVASKVTPISLATCDERLIAPGNPADAIPKVYIRCTQSSLPQSIAVDLRGTSGWDVTEVDGCHDIMVTNPDRLVNVLTRYCDQE